MCSIVFDLSITTTLDSYVFLSVCVCGGGSSSIRWHVGKASDSAPSRVASYIGNWHGWSRRSLDSLDQPHRHRHSHTPHVTSALLCDVTPLAQGNKKQVATHEAVIVSSRLVCMETELPQKAACNAWKPARSFTHATVSLNLGSFPKQKKKRGHGPMHGSAPAAAEDIPFGQILQRLLVRPLSAFALTPTRLLPACVMCPVFQLPRTCQCCCQP
jgi:hypothetical protein